MNNSFFRHEICFEDVVKKQNLWNSGIPAIAKPLPMLVFQMAVSVFVNHGLFVILQYFQQPRIVADIFTAMILSRELWKDLSPEFTREVFPDSSQTNLETVANLGLLYAMFIKGLHVELSLVVRKTTKILTLAYAVIILPFTVGCALYLGYRKTITLSNVSLTECMLWGTVTAGTSFPTLAPFLPKLKLLCTDIGREALSMGMIHGVFSWFLMFITLGLSSGPNTRGRNIVNARQIVDSVQSMPWVLGFMLLFLLICALIIRPLLSRMVRNVPEGENYSDFTIQLILFMVLACGLAADCIGSHFMFGAFVFGMSIPNGVAATLIEKMEDCVMGILMPLYFLVVGTRLDLVEFFKNFKFLWAIMVCVTCKAVCTLLLAVIFKMDAYDGMALGVLLSAKGLLPVVITNIARERQHVSEAGFTGLIMVILLSNIMIGPMMTLYKRFRKCGGKCYEQRTIERADPSNELRMITCIYSPRNVPSIINLLELTNLTPQTPVAVYALHLVEQVGQAPAMLIEHSARDSSSSWGIGVKPLFNRIRAHSEQIISAFHEYEEQHATGGFIQTMTVVSPVDTMHEDICSLAENKQASLIILAFHKQQGVDGKLEDANLEFRSVNENVMTIAPCSVGLLVDRGLRIFSMSTSNMGGLDRANLDQEIRIAMVYIGGPDDREALTYAWRMASHPNVTLRVIRFVQGDNITPTTIDHYGGATETRRLTILTQDEKEKQMDQHFLYKFQQGIVHDPAIQYTEMVSNSGDQTIEQLRQFHREFDLYVVGRSEGVVSPLVKGLAEWSDCPELGAMGDVLITSDFAMNASVLVIQQYKLGASYNNATFQENMHYENGVRHNNAHFEQP